MFYIPGADRPYDLSWSGYETPLNGCYGYLNCRGWSPGFKFRSPVSLTCPLLLEFESYGSLDGWYSPSGGDTMYEGYATVILCLTAPDLSATLRLGVRRFLMTVRLPPGIERIVKDAVHSGQYRSAEEVLSEAIGVWQAQRTAAEPTEDDRQAAIERLKSFGKTHQLSLGGLTLKQLRDEARP